MAKMRRSKKGSHFNRSSPKTSIPVVSHNSSSLISTQDSHLLAMNRIGAVPHLDCTELRGTSDVTWASLFSAIAKSTTPAWVQTAVMICFIFGGCCTNVSL